MDIRKFFNKKARLQLEDQPHSSKQIEENVETGDSAVIPSTSKSEKDFRVGCGIPDDIAQLGEPIKQIVLNNYPRENNRAFVADWFKRFKWLQYSVKRDAAFCYPCQQFLPHGSKQNSYTGTGFRNWKNATDSKCGFPNHEKTLPHMQAMSMWEEKIRRTTTSSSVGTLLNQNVLEKYRYYIKSIIEVIQFLAVNELAFRGNYELDEEKEKGLFQSLFEYTIKKDPILKEAIVHIPQNAKYRSPEIQNQIIQAMSETVRESIAADIQESDVPWFTLMEDGTRDKNNRENIAIGVRFVKNGAVKESLLTVITTKNLDAATFTDATMDILMANKIDLSRLLSQCYDGASVMSGKISGVAVRIEEKLKRKIPYVHCYNHRLHLVVVRTISEMAFIREFFDQCVMMHEFFQHAKVASLYEGKTIGRLLEQRWSGHFAVTKVISENYHSILKTLDLDDVRKSRFGGDDIAKSIGIKSVMLSIEFRLAMLMTRKILCVLQPADAALQGRSTGLKDAILIIKCVNEEIFNLRSEDTYKKILEEAQNLIEKESENMSRKRQVKARQSDDFVMFGPSTSRQRHQSGSEPLKAEYYETLDIILAEMKRRFSDNEDLLNSISCLDELDVEKMLPLKNLGECNSLIY